MTYKLTAVVNLNNESFQTRASSMQRETILTAASAFCLKQSNTIFKLRITNHHPSLLVATRLILVAVSALQQFTKSNLLAAASSHLATTSSINF